MQDYPRVGTGVYIRRNGKVLMGKRSGKSAPGYWCPPGGKLEMNEDPFECARRETLEETGIEIDNLRLVGVTNDMWPKLGSHYLTFHFATDWETGEARMTEPDKFERWEWFDWNALPHPLLLATQNFVAKGIDPFTAVAIRL